MPKCILYILLYVYSTSIVKPVLPYLKDFAAHMFWHAHHMATAHHSDGGHAHQHIREDLSAASDQQDNSRHTGHSKKTVTETEEFYQHFDIFIDQAHSKQEYKVHPVQILVHFSALPDIPPPKA